MRMDDDQLATLRDAFAAQPNNAPQPEICPAPEKIWDAVRGELPPDRIREIVEHTALCASCAEDWRLARTFQAQETAARTVTPTNVVPFAPRQRLRNFALAIAAALALVVVGVQWFQRPQINEPGYREGGPQAGIRSLLPEGEALPRDRFVLRWAAPGAPGATYDVQVSTEDLQVVATAEDVRGTEYQVPESALAGLPASTRLLWKVEADLPGGGGLSSPTFVTPLR